ncbi:unnamed protein product [Spirodela intermedia]|uniref:Uncharacterized protein n=1 Tax=Spirodela intermedia TaxID=51605 RepID=A0A7I8JFW2_SPIIN|nr:unnamed protein product [Spirodela intermedia]CAA6668821.1 unnamed protein product [Spirodela intermedia]
MEGYIHVPPPVPPSLFFCREEVKRVPRHPEQYGNLVVSNSNGEAAADAARLRNKPSLVPPRFTGPCGPTRPWLRGSTPSSSACSREAALAEPDPATLSPLQSPLPPPSKGDPVPPAQKQQPTPGEGPAAPPPASSLPVQALTPWVQTPSPSPKDIGPSVPTPPSDVLNPPSSATVGQEKRPSPQVAAAPVEILRFPQTPHPEPETKPVVSSEPKPTPTAVNGPSENDDHPDDSKLKWATTGGGEKDATAPSSTPQDSSNVKKRDTAVAAAPRRKPADDGTERGVSVGGGGHRGERKNHGRRLAESTKNVAPGTTGGKPLVEDEVKGAFKSKAGASSSKPPPMVALVNSNVQSVNNSVMLNSSCVQQSPGVYITSPAAGAPLAHGRRNSSSRDDDLGSKSAELDPCLLMCENVSACLPSD